jgi:hypothetical protein
MMYAAQSLGWLVVGVILGVPLGEALRPFVPRRMRRR